MNGVLTVAGVYNATVVAGWTGEQQAKHEATLEASRNMDTFGVVEVADRPQEKTSPLDLLRAQTAIGRYIQSSTFARCFEQTVSPNADVFTLRLQNLPLYEVSHTICNQRGSGRFSGIPTVVFANH